MGVRLKGTPLARRPGELVSEAVAPGAVQITNDGLPVVLAWMGKRSAVTPRSRTSFAPILTSCPTSPARTSDSAVTPDEADAAAKERAAFLNTWLARLRAAERQPSSFDLARFRSGYRPATSRTI